MKRLEGNKRIHLAKREIEGGRGREVVD